jgi:pyrroline-5-carboxylate reductase
MEGRVAGAAMRSDVLAGARVAFVGSGAMGEAMIGGLLARQLVSADAVTAADPRTPRTDELRQRYGIRTTGDNRAAVRDADIVVLAVKPQVLPTVLENLRGAVRTDALVISIAAGVRLESLATSLRHQAVVRSMPNTPAQIGEGMTVWIAAAQVNAKQRGQTQALLGALGRELAVHEEVFLDMATAVSGSGPAYVFLLMEALIDAAVHLGLPRADARTLVLQTVRGSAGYALQSDLDPAELRNQVTSPGGTTAHALRQLEKAGFRAAIADAVWAAFQRSVVLGERAATGKE